LRILQKWFISVSLNYHHLEYRKVKDAESAFVRKLMDQGHKGNGFMIASARGKLLAKTWAGGINLRFLNDGLASWRELPASERKPGAFKVKAPKGQPLRSIPQAPAGGLILRVYQRNLKRTSKGGVARITDEDREDRTRYPGWQHPNTRAYSEPSSDVMWLTKEEVRSLVPANPRVGARVPIPKGVKYRLIRFHLVDGTRGLARPWWLDSIRSENLGLTVESASPVLRLRLEGKVDLADNRAGQNSKRSYRPRLLGYLEYDRKKKRFRRFDVVAVGDLSVEKDHNSGARPGANPLGIAFELATGRVARDLGPPVGLRQFEKYFKAEKP
jgi:hypothetical protein